MQINTYTSFCESYFKTTDFAKDFQDALRVIKNSKKIFFIGNGGSNAICSHMLEDYAKIARFKTFAFSDPALITCFANDYGYENAMMEWLRIYFEKDDLLVSISSSGNSMNILNATNLAKSSGGKVITLSGFKPQNSLRTKGDVNFYLNIENYGVVECFHQVILHALLDEHVKSTQV